MQLFMEIHLRAIFSPIDPLVTHNRVKEQSQSFEGHLNIVQHLKIYKYANFHENPYEGDFLYKKADVLFQKVAKHIRIFIRFGQRAARGRPEKSPERAWRAGTADFLILRARAGRGMEFFGRFRTGRAGTVGIDVRQCSYYSCSCSQCYAEKFKIKSNDVQAPSLYGRVTGTGSQNIQYSHIANTRVLPSVYRECIPSNFNQT